MRVGMAKIIMSPIPETQGGRSRQSSQTSRAVSSKCAGSYTCPRIDPTSIKVVVSGSVIVVTSCKQPWQDLEGCTGGPS